MVYIYTEDSKSGRCLCDLIYEQYFKGQFDDVKVDTLNGIWKLKEQIEVIKDNITPNDTVIIVYDDIRENPIVDVEICEASDYIDANGLDEQFLWLPTNSFEIEILCVAGIEFL